MRESSIPRTLFQKIWDSHVVANLDDDLRLVYIDLHLVNEVTSPQAFEGLRQAGRRVRRPQATIAVADHNVPTTDRAGGILDEASRVQVDALERNVVEFDIPYVPLLSPRQGIVHVVGPELGMTLPGMTIVCGDSHTSTHGAFGALAFGIGTSEAEHVLATQTLVQKRARNLLIDVDGALEPGVSAKDLILATIAQIGTGGATGHVVEYAGEAIRALDMAGRMTMCNMSIEAGARAGLIVPDETTFAYLKARPLSPKGTRFEELTTEWSKLRSDPGATYDRTVRLNATKVAPMVTWGTAPDTAVPIDGAVPDLPSTAGDDHARQMRQMLEYMQLVPGQPLEGLRLDAVFIGSCTNSRIEDLRAAASILEGRRVAPHVRALVVPGSGLVKRQAEQEGLAEIFRESGFEWREAGCSMCIGMNPDRLRPGERCASTSNRNFEGRQGPGGRTQLGSPIMAAAAALEGRLVDVRRWL
jgi:3-isopropylmalate/(R)-2-methylmalate dehydratase large subunit